MIKKIIFGMVLAASATACTDDYTDWVQPQENEAPEAVTFGNGSVSEVNVINFVDFTEGQEAVKVCNITAPKSSDASYTPEYTINLGSESYTIDADGNMAVNDLVSYVENTYGKRPTQRDIDATVSMWLGNGTTTVKTVTSGVFTIKAVPVAPQISENYYIVGGTLDWATSAASKEQKFNHSDKDVYDDPIFTIVIPASADGDTWFAIGDDEACDAIANNDWSKLFGTKSGNGNNGFEGALDRRTNLSDDGSFCVPGGSKFIQVTINMMDYTYTITPLSYGSFFYEIGNESGWSESHALYGANGDGKYQGYYYLDGEFKFKPNADNWDGDYEYDGEGRIADNGGANCPDPGAGFYQIDVDLAAGTYNLTLVSSISAIGDFNSWGGDVDLAYNVSTGAWEAEGIALSGGVKFRMNHDWTISWGGANGDGNNFNDLTQNNGANLNVEEGVYDIQLFISYEGANKVILTKK